MNVCSLHNLHKNYDYIYVFFYTEPDIFYILICQKYDVFSAPKMLLFFYQEINNTVQNSPRETFKKIGPLGGLK